MKEDLNKCLRTIALSFCVLLLGCDRKPAATDMSQTSLVENSGGALDDAAALLRANLNRSNVVLGVHTGSTMDAYTHKYYPNAKIEYYNTTPDMAYCLSQGKIDGFLNEEPTARVIMAEIPALSFYAHAEEQVGYGFLFAKNPHGEKLCHEMNDFISDIKASGEMQELDAVWFGSNEENKVVDMSGLTAENGVLTFASCATLPPFAYIKDTAFAGYDVDMAVRFCRRYGYGIKFVDTDIPSIILGCASGQYDFAASCITITEERKKSVNFSIPNYNGCLVMMVQKDKLNTLGSAHSTGKKHVIARLSDFNQSSVVLGVRTGTLLDVLTEQNFPLAHAEQYNTTPDMVLRVLQGDMDGFLVDEPTIRYIEMENPEITYLEELLEPQDYGFIFQKTPHGEKLRNQMNTFLKKLVSDGTLAEIDDLWFGKDEERKNVDYESLTSKNGMLTLAIDSATPPFDYVVNNRFAGYEVDLAFRFCRQYGYGLKIIDAQFASVMTGVVSGSYDMGAAAITINEERKEKVHFSDPVYHGGVAMAVKKDSLGTGGADLPQKPGFFSSLSASFEKTFVRESRWKLIVSGIGVTILISLLSAIFGTLLGFTICALRLSKNRIADGGAVVYIRIMQGMPMVVLLMILFYIVFAKSELSGIWVAVIGFGMNFGAYVSEMIRTGILAVDKGQTEAALALGYTKMNAFIKVVLPQASRHFLPVYQGEFISLVKMTSVVGYIAIQDLTKAGDIIRSRTYEAFFPLIATAIIYFMIAFTLTRILTFLQVRLDPRKRKEVVAKKIHGGKA
ncbi:MAG: ABC transporter permease subunit [Treponema sp.]|nr:ABC transporter permease subunit [Treponema sp.]